MTLAIIIGLVLTAAGVLALFGGRAELARIRGTPLIRCGEARGGGHLVRAAGRAHSNAPVEAPFSGKRCVLYRVVVEYAEHNRRRDNNSFHQATTLRYADDASVADDSGALMLALEGGRLSLSTVAHGKDHVAKKIAEDMLPSRNGYTVRGVWEERLDPGEPVLAVGVVERTRAGLVLGGDQKLEVWGGGEKRLRQVNRGADLVAFGLIVAGALVAAVGAAGYFDAEEEPDPSGLPAFDSRR